MREYIKSIFLLLAITVCLNTPAMAIDPPGQLVVTDPVWYEEPFDHNTFQPTDLTEVRIINGPDELIIDIPFQSDWDGLQLHVLLETNFDSLGALSDAFEQPVIYNHVFKPDYVITCKYSTNDYGDFRRWISPIEGWEFFNPVLGEYSSEGNIAGVWTTKDSDSYSLNIPWAPFGGIPDSLMVEVYLTQDVGIKRSAFDSVPPDETLDLDFDYEDPQPGDWNVALGPVYLSSWSPVYHLLTEFLIPPVIAGTAVVPDTIQAGAELLLLAHVVDGGDGIGPVLTDLSSLGGGTEEFLYDDGNPAHGDGAEGDGVYSLIWSVPDNWFNGDYPLQIKAYDSQLIQYASATVTISILPGGSPIVDAEDPLGDDHGPNQPGNQRFFYTYPSNEVFVPGAFDLTKLTIDLIMVNFIGVLEERIAFIVEIANFPDPSVPGHANWNPYYGDLNIEKIDILIDSDPGGAIASLPWRQAGYQAWDAWEYAIVMDGWYKAVIPSLGSNLPDVWRINALRTDADILLVSDFTQNTITALVSSAALGNPTEEDIRSWDICVQIGSHDAGGEEVLGGIRWVNEGRSEWQFGGGQSGDRDANLIDLLLVPGTGKTAGRPQEYVLDYESPEALDRLAQGLTPVAIEMTEAGVSEVLPAVTRKVALAQNSPNPFNPRTTIAFELPDQASVNLNVYDVAGRLVRVLLDNETFAPGRNEVVWNGRDGSDRQVASGTYFYRLDVGDFSKTKRMTLVR
jgi:hypothetical protein